LEKDKVGNERKRKKIWNGKRKSLKVMSNTKGGARVESRSV